ncbi:MAG TPA: hypothetical protein VGI52_09695 [Solirubrobacteraceae bacterium]
MSTRAILALLATCALSLGAAPARAMSSEQQNPLNDQGSSPNYRSTVTSVSPQTSGLTLHVLQFSDRLLLRNETGRTVSVEGYEGEPYARVKADGTVEVNTASPAYYLNQSFYGNVTVPPSATAQATPRWKVVDRTGQFEWHDHRIHWMSPALPPQVKDKGKRTLIFDWHVPIAVGARKGTVAGSLFWTPESSSAPVAAIVIGGVIVLLSVLLVVVVRRRRTPRGPLAQGGGEGPADPAGAPGARADSGHREAW